MVRNTSAMQEDPSSTPGSGRSLGEGIDYPLQYSWVPLVAQLVKNPPAMWETWVLSLGWEEDPWGTDGNPFPYSCLESPRGQRSLAGCSPGGHRESDRTEWLRTGQHKVDLQRPVSFMRGKVNQLYIHIYPLFRRLFSHIGHYRMLSSFLCCKVGPYSCLFYI